MRNTAAMLKISADGSRLGDFQPLSLRAKTRPFSLLKGRFLGCTLSQPNEKVRLGPCHLTGLRMNEITDRKIYAALHRIKE